MADPCNKTTRWPSPSLPEPELMLYHHDPVEYLAIAMEESMFAQHERPVDRRLHRKFRNAARAALEALRAS